MPFNEKYKPTEDEVLDLAWRYHEGSLTETQFNYWVNAWDVDPIYVQQILIDFKNVPNMALWIVVRFIFWIALLLLMFSLLCV